MKTIEKVILITGADGKAGSAAAQKFKSNGWKVVGIDIKKECSIDHAAFLDDFICCDVRDRSNMIESVRIIEEKHGAIEALFTAAGVELNERFENTSPIEWKNVLDTCLAGTANACAAVAPHMVERKNGRIVVLSPDYGKTESGHILDATAAGTLHGFIKSFGVELAKNEVMANAIFANVPFDLDGLASTVMFLAERGDYITAQVISIRGEE